MIVRVTIVLLCGVGLYASAFMARKARRAARGELGEPSVVETPRARVAGGVPNAAIGLVYYAAVAVAVPLLGVWDVWWLVLAAALGAAAFSAYLAYSLLFVTRMPCVYCWTSHVTNWMLVALVILARPHAG
ncbi:MAG: hypothetical protein IAI50_11300 [Candidatus Eremiobacteraeota bacterium]|nr:hypothetical protein [Candidatus Eremiobacteraeota bacterium]